LIEKASLFGFIPIQNNKRDKDMKLSFESRQGISTLSELESIVAVNRQIRRAVWLGRLTPSLKQAANLPFKNQDFTQVELNWFKP
jgi:hypothetical protein